jgi:DNA-binding transcriptional LysR family regulator
MPAYTLRQLEYFVAVAETGSVTRAAARCHLSQSAMSAALAELERVLAVQLVMRQHARGIALTAAGSELLHEARRLLSQADDLQLNAAHLGGSVTGRLSVGCFNVLAPYVLPELLSASTAAYPELALDTTEERLDQLVAGLREGRTELAIGYDIDLDPGLETRSLFTVPPHVVLPAGHRLARRRRVRLEMLAEEPLILLDLPHSRDYFARLFSAAGVQPAVAYRTQSADMARALVARGGGYCVLNLRPRSAVSVNGRPYVMVSLDTPLPTAESDLRVVLLTLGELRLTRRAEAVIELARRLTYIDSTDTLGR